MHVLITYFYRLLLLLLSSLFDNSGYPGTSENLNKPVRLLIGMLIEVNYNIFLNNMDVDIEGCVIFNRDLGVKD